MFRAFVLVLFLTACVQQPQPATITVYADRQLEGEEVYWVCVRSVAALYVRYGYVDESTLPFIYAHCEEMRRLIMDEQHISAGGNSL